MIVISRIVSLCLIVACAAVAQPAPTGTIAVDFHESLILADTSNVADHGRSAKRSLWLAGGLSALLPGTGQLYAGAPLWKSLMFGGIEVGSMTAYFVFSSRGNELTEEFQAYADRHWSVLRYVQWIERNLERWPDENVDRDAARRALADIYRDAPAGAPDWERVDFAALARLERAVLSGFSHTLPEHGEQQYYEQLGKYAQYRAGWDDHGAEGDTAIYDPTRVTSRNIQYMDLRASANNRLAWAGAALGVAVLNHLVSTLDAVLAARTFNARLLFNTDPGLGAHEEIGIAVGLAVNF